MSGRAFHLRRREVEVLHAVATPPCQLRLWRPCAPFVCPWHLRFTVGCQLAGIARNFFRALAVALRFAQSALARPCAIMRSMLVLCLALCAFGHCFASSLRVERRGLSREGRVGAEAFMIMNGKSGPQEMCLTIADGASIDAYVCVWPAWRGARFCLIYRKAPAATMLLCWNPVSTPLPLEMVGSCG